MQLAQIFARLDTSACPAFLEFDHRGHLFVGCDNESEVVELDRSGVEVHRYETRPLSRQTTLTDMKCSAGDHLWLTRQGQDAIIKLNVVSGEVFEYMLPPGSSPAALVVVGGDAFSANTAADTISRVASDGSSAETFASLPAGSRPVSLVADSAGRLHTFNAGSAKITMIGVDGDVKRVVDLPRQTRDPLALVRETGRTLLLVSASGLLRFDIRNASFEELCTFSVSAFGKPGSGGVVYDHALYLPTGTAEVLHVSLNEPYSVKVIALGGHPWVHACAFDSQGNLYAGDWDFGLILRLEPR